MGGEEALFGADAEGYYWGGEGAGEKVVSGCLGVKADEKAYFGLGGLLSGFLGFSVLDALVVAACSRKDRLDLLGAVTLVARCLEKLSL